MEIGFVDLDVMGKPMALNLARVGKSLIVWNRSAEKCEPLRAAGASVAESATEVSRRTAITILMMVDSDVTDAVLERSTPYGSGGFSISVCPGGETRRPL